MPLVSVIVPVYKAEKWLHRCVDSILAQTMDDFELLLIDDGSPDRSGEICDDYAAKDSRVRVFHKENGGVSSARNWGLDNAQGEWISFIDADDWVEVDYLAGLTEKLDADFILGGVKISESVQSNMLDCLYSDLEMKDCLEKYLLDIVLLSPWGNLLRNDILQNNHIRFDEKIHYAEDRVFNRQYLLCCTNARIISLNSYNYAIEEQNIDYADKFSFLTIEEVDYLCLRLNELNKKLESKFQCLLKDELREHILCILNSEKNLHPTFLSDYYVLCQKYYPKFTLEVFCADPILSPLVKYICKLKDYYFEKKYDKVRVLFYKLKKMSEVIPKHISFKYKDFYLWYFLIKCGWWRVFDFLMKLYCRLK